MGIFPKKIKEKFKDNEDVDLKEIVSNLGKIGKDLAKVNFDFENSYYHDNDSWGDNLYGPMQIGDLSFISCSAGGDWEFPVYFIIYLDKDKKTFRGYIPNNGNPWNRDTNTAFGNDDDADSKFLSKWIKKNRSDLWKNADQEYEMDDADVMYEPEAIKKDIIDRIKVLDV